MPKQVELVVVPTTVKNNRNNRIALPQPITECIAKLPENHSSEMIAEIKSSICLHLAFLKKKEKQARNKEIKAAYQLLHKMHKTEYTHLKDWIAAQGEHLDAKTALECLERFLEGMRYQASKKNLKNIVKRQSTKTEKIESNLKLLPNIEKTRADRLSEYEKSNEITYGVIYDHNCTEFWEAYRVLRDYFPSDELDPISDLMKMLDQNGGRFQKLSGNNFIKHAPELTEPIYLRYYMAVAKDRNGELIGVCDGNIICTKTESAIYWAHIAVPEEHRRMGVASLLEGAMFALGNMLAKEAETALATRYETAITDNKLMYFIVECEPANLQNEEQAKLTLGRLVFHGNNGLSAIPSLRYSQIDLEFSPNDKFEKKEWNSVPLLLLIRRMGKEKETSLDANEAKRISNIMTLSFLSAGLYNADGARFDYKHSIKYIKENEKIDIVNLPTSVNGLDNFINEVGDMVERCRKLYPDHLWAIEYLKKIGETGCLTLEQGIELLKK